MNTNRWKVILLAAVVVMAGCEAAEDRLRSLLYDDADSVVPTPQDEEQLREQRTVQPGEHPDRATQIEVSRDIEPVYATLDEPGETHWFSLQTPDDEQWIVDLEVEPEDSSLDPVIYLEAPGEDAAPLRYDIAGAGETEEVPLLRIDADGTPRRFSITGADDSTGEYRVQLQRRLSAATVATAPGDIPELAMELEVPGEVQGFYDRPGDRDVFFVPAESLRAGIYSLELSAVAGIEQTLQIFGDEQLNTPLIQIGVSENAPAIIPNLSLDARQEGDDAGLYFVLTADDDSFDRERGYRLRLVEHPDSDHDDFVVEREPNDTEGTAQRVEFGQPVRGYFHTPDDVDRFRFEIEDPDAVEDDEQQEDEEAADGDDESEDVAEDVAEEATDEDEDGDHLPESLRRMLAEQADFEAEDREDLEQLRDEEGLQVVDPWESVEEKEPNEYVVQTRLKPISETHRMGMRWLPGEGTGESPMTVVADDEEEELVICNRVVGPGDYQVEVWSEQTDEGFRPRSYDYEFQLLNISRMPGLEIEPNDSTDTADRLEMGESRTGFIAEDGDRDFYAFVVGPDEPYLVEIDDEDDDGAGGWEAPETESVQVMLEGNRLDLQFELIDDEGGRVAHVDEGGPGSDEQLRIDLPHGLYYVAVRAGIGSNCEPYHIEVTTP